MPATIEFYDGANWLPILLGALQGTDNQITVTPRPHYQSFYDRHCK